QPPNGIGPRCSANGPSTATGRKRRAPMITMVPMSSPANVPVSSRSVPRPNGADFFAPRLAAIAIGAMMGMKRLMMITSPATMSKGVADGAGVGFAARPYDTPSPSKAEPLFADAEENWYRICDIPWGPGLLTAFRPQLVAAKRPVGHRIMIGWMSSAIIAS